MKTLPTVKRSTAATSASPRGAGEPSIVLERYRLYRRLGAGGFGTVWMARDQRLDRDVAVKIVPRERIVVGRFEREARAAARLSHPGIVTLYEATVDDHAAYLVSELVRGSTLHRLLEDGRLSDRDLVAIALALCEALSHAHAQGVVHRDVKPSNVLVPERPSSPAHPAKLTDFGVARVIGGDSLTRAGDVVGTAAYMAPEQAEGREAGASADLYSLALLTYEALTGVNPVRIGPPAVRARRLGAHLPPLRRQRRDLPRELGRGVDLALRPRPRERGTIDELHETLLVALEEVEDTPGLVELPWSRPRAPRAQDRLGAHPPDDHLQDGPGALDVPMPMPAWPARAVAATAAAAATGWLAAHLIAKGPPAPPALAVIAWMLVAALPRLGWVTTTVGLAAAATAHHHPGGALMLMIAALAPVLLLPRHGVTWPLPVAAPALGLIGLAGAWPAIVPRITVSAYRRAALAATGWLWIVLAAPLAGADLYTRRPPGTPLPSQWTGSLGATLTDVIKPILTSGVLAGAAVWGIAAVVLPWLVRGRSLPHDLVLVTIWAATTVSATEVAIASLRPGHELGVPPTAVVGALAGGLLALAPALRTAWRESRLRANSGAELP